MKPTAPKIIIKIQQQKKKKKEEEENSLKPPVFLKVYPGNLG
jgi:hypothetical protein